ncbi:MAG TPA: hypothetical protein VMJ10_34335 [Kofleriaceae bacterium]|nr:hypothetical protein [Kofleriaceae bacterium]
MRTVAVVLIGAAGAARADDATATTTASSTAQAPQPDDLDVRLTLSTFLFHQSGSDPAPLVSDGANPQNASPVERFFTDLRGQLSDGGFAFDGRIRETTSELYQSGADGGGEYEIRTLDYRLGSPSTHVTIGRQFIEAVGQTKIDGAAFEQRLAGGPSGGVNATVFAGAFPDLGSRSVDTDYLHVVNADGTQGSILIPLTAGAGATYSTNDYHGDLGIAGVYAAQDVPMATTDQRSRIFTTSSGYWRPTRDVDIYHFALLDVAGASGVNLTSGNVGVDARPTSSFQLGAQVSHYSNDLLQIAARNTLEDPDPSAVGIVQNNITLLHVSQDMVRGTASVALAQQRFQISVFGSAYRRPDVSVPLSDGTGSVVFPEAKSADGGITVLDRRSVAGLRIALSAMVTDPIGSEVPNRSRGSVVRVVVSRTFAQQRGELELDAAYEHFDDVFTQQACATSIAPLACFGTSSVDAGQGGALFSWRVAREWLLVADAQLGYQRLRSTFTTPMTPGDPSSPLEMLPVHWPGAFSITGFARLQWRYR